MTKEQLRRMRKDLGMSQKSLGELLGISEAMICLYERGKNKIQKNHRVIVFALWLEKIAPVTPKISMCINADDAQIARTIEMVDQKSKREADIENLWDRLGPRC